MEPQSVAARQDATTGPHDAARDGRGRVVDGHPSLRASGRSPVWGGRARTRARPHPLDRPARNVEVGDSPEARLEAIASRARLMLRRLGDPETEMQDLLTALGWIVEVAEGEAPVP